MKFNFNVSTMLLNILHSFNFVSVLVRTQSYKKFCSYEIKTVFTITFLVKKILHTEWYGKITNEIFMILTFTNLLGRSARVVIT